MGWRHARTGLLVVVFCTLVGTAQAGVSSVTMTPDRPAPQPAGTTIRWTVAVTGGAAPYSYKWWLWDGAVWALLRDWNTAATFDWTPPTANGGYRLGVWVRSAGNTADKDEANNAAYFAISAPPSPTTRVTALGLTSDRVAPQAAGSTVNWTAQPTGGITPQSYKWWLWDGSTWLLLRDWNTSATFAWTPQTANAGYRIGVWARSAGNSADTWEVNQAANFSISAPPTATALSLTPDRTAPQPSGTTITWTVQPTGGVAPLSYKWWLWDGSAWQLLRDWNTSPTYAWTPASSNANFRIGVWARSAGNSADTWEVNQAAYFSITGSSTTTSPPASSRTTALSLAADRVAPQVPGTAITWTASPTGGVAPHSYKWWIWDGSSWQLLRDWSTSPTLTWTPPVPNNEFRIGVWVKSAGNAADTWETNQAAYFSIFAPGASTTVGTVAMTASVTPPQAANTAIGFSVSATGGVLPRSFKWWLFDGAQWTALSDWTTNTTFEWRPARPNEAYRIGVWARSANNSADANEAYAAQAFPIRGSGCVDEVGPSVITMGNGGGSATITVRSASGCSWSGVSGANWVSITANHSGTGNGTITIALAANPDRVSRAGEVTIGGRSVSITQAGTSTSSGCTYAVYPTVLDLPVDNGTEEVAVTAPAGCTWSVSDSGFAHPSTSSGVGSATVRLSIENNTGAESRATVLTIAGRAVTVRQAGTATGPSTCPVSVSPSEASFDFHAVSGSIQVSAPSGCGWSAAAASPFVHLIGATSGSGSGSVAFALETNGESGARSALLMVGGSPVTLNQGAATLTVTCTYSLSQSAATMSYAGGQGAVSITTGDGCEWDVSSHADWIHIVEKSGPGNGNMWFFVDGNSESARAGTIVVAGQTLTISQPGPPLNPDSNDITWTTPSDSGKAGDCFGNCGAGCGTAFNPCGGEHYWQHSLLSLPQYTGDSWEPICGDGSSSSFVVRPRYTALARWTFHGLRSSSCEEHDVTCRTLGFLPPLLDFAACVVTAGLVGMSNLNYCNDARPYDWSYDFVDVGYGPPAAYIDGPASCN